MKNISVIILCLVLFTCKEASKLKAFTAEDIVNASIEISGGERFATSNIEFDFRDKSYLAKRNKGSFLLARTFTIEEDSVFDILTNEGFERHINDSVNVFVEDSMAVKYSASVNSVHYFSVLPFGLNDEAVNKKLLGEEQIKGKMYYKIEITFSQQGGGEDYEDVFIYWIDKISFKADYIAYSYNESDGKGMRFREAYNERYINDLRFVDYNNYKAINSTTKLTDLGHAFNNNQLKLLSKIELKNVEVELIDL
ncbi:DUF6503 family protein [uncultured Winogradskyella sp.]|uniref:DUF6503 family protein n=1 Tax=uncultured Winogradskyella sp. TaxID=395353 RepID=UPI002632E331|nr:DUF6503 family protein [uncultured Winogradskyella sp.]